MSESDGPYEAALQNLLDWWEAWYAAWDALAESGACDYRSGAEFTRVSNEAWAANVPACQTAMRRWIRERANIGPVPSITDKSVARRLENLERRRKEGKHDR